MIIKVALSADTILYTPFFMAYYGGDFDDTPYGSLSVKILGENDNRFNTDKNLKGDGFATFCLLFGLADVAICDPSYLVYLNDLDSNELSKEFINFQSLLTGYTIRDIRLKGEKKYKEYLKLKKGSNVISEKDEITLFKEVDKEDDELYKEGKERIKIADASAFIDLYLKDKKIIGGLISKIAFSVITSPDLEMIVNAYDGDILFGIKHNSIDKYSFTKNEVTNKFVFYNKPSTGYVIGNIHSERYGINKVNNRIEKDLGKEIQYLKNNNKSVAFSCDYVTIDFLKDRTFQDKINKADLDDILNYISKLKFLEKGIEKDESQLLKKIEYISKLHPNYDLKIIDAVIRLYIKASYKKKISTISESIYNEINNNVICEIADFAKSDDNYLYTGILGYTKIDNKLKLKAFLYGIDKNLFFINSFLKTNDLVGLTAYFKKKFNYTKDNEKELLGLLIADDDTKTIIEEKVNSEEDSFDFDSVIDFYVKRLGRWGKRNNSTYNGLYYDKTAAKNIIKENLKSMYELRLKAKNINAKKENINAILKEIVEDDMLGVWRVEEKEYFDYKNKMNDSKYNYWNTFLLFLLAPLRFFILPYRKKDRHQLWHYINKTNFIYMVGSIFIAFEVVASLSHIFGIHFEEKCISLPFKILIYDRLNIYAFFFLYLSVVIVYLILNSRILIKVKEREKYVYRNE